MYMLEFQNVVKKIKGHCVIDDVSLCLEERRVYGFRGINGSGKTMLMKLAAGLIYPTTGSVVYKGKVLGKEISFPEDMGLLIETPAFLERYTGLDNLKMLGEIKGKMNVQSISKALLEVGLDPDDKRKYKKYSLGMKQRLGIAAAIFENPELIILDEPTNALDTAGIKLLKQVINTRKEKSLILFTCHDGEILTELSDEIFEVENGKIMQAK